MAWSVDWEGELVVGGDGNRRLTPNFRLKEFQQADGSVRVHRELVSALQILRNRFAKPITLLATDGDGLGARITGEPLADLLSSADALEAHRLFATAESTGSGDVRVRLPPPDVLPEIGLEQALETAFSVTSAFETSGDKFQQVTGNFDGAGLSFGPAQVNFKSGTLEPLFRDFEAADEPALRACFDDPVDYEEWRRVLDLPVAEQIEWANGVSTGRNNGDVIQPWKGYLKAVGRVATFRALMVERILCTYGRKLVRAVNHLQKLAPAVPIDHLRCMCSLYDLVVQQGSLDRAREEIETRVKTEKPRDQFELVEIAVSERGRKANPPWRDDTVSRRVGILKGVPFTVGERQRMNVNFYMLRNVRIAQAQELIDADVSEELERVSQTLAAGGTLLA